MLDVRRLQILRAVVSSGSVTAAAANLGYTPSAISQQLAVLEKEARTSLLEKAGRGVRPTAAGLLLAKHAAVLTAQLAAAEAELADLRAGRTGRLRVTFFATAGAMLVPPAVAAFRRSHPDVQLDLALRDPQDPLAEVLTGEADLAVVVVIGAVPVLPGVRFLHLLDDPYRVVLPREHPLAEESGPVDLARLAGEPWVEAVSFPGPCRQLVLDACAAAGFTPNPSAVSDDFPSAQGFVAAGLGMALIPTLGLGITHPGVAVRPLRNPEPVRQIYAAARESQHDHPAVQGFLHALTNAAEAVCAHE
ncbi:LysR family transcriptional regulator [Streptoalloteichus hindustanus]|uniref:DNA-binding transcriptional regulator, LysR family n=1 Tax=Streptoalloteichus hindustanus TaxID=2017 RepID=A0A1M4T7T9_STRHI|nr:LysR family transcriptional regulator [Streptoalloteichus hindustanus]SHE40454.1 DNA-binding transcriptional regulator, LysR family [Streptoalloteichus hindustanus]